MIIFVDIDDTICYIEREEDRAARDYSKAQPLLRNIERVNQYYDEGHTVIYWTARGSGAPRGQNWFKVTQAQLFQWGAKFHELRMGKPVYDLLICDKSMNPKAEWE